MAVSLRVRKGGAPAVPARPPARDGARRGRAGYGFVSAYFVLLLLFGVAPTLYAVWLALTNSSGQLVGIGNFTQVLGDYRFLPAFEDVAVYLGIWLVVLVVAVVGLALMLHGRLLRASAVSRFVFYLPGALAGAASALVWMFMLDPSVSPVAWLLHALGYSSFADVIAPQWAAGRLRRDGILDRRRRLDRGDVRGAQQHPRRTARGGQNRRLLGAADRVARADPDAAQVDRLHGDPRLRHRHAAVRAAA